MEYPKNRMQEANIAFLIFHLDHKKPAARDDPHFMTFNSEGLVVTESDNTLLPTSLMDDLDFDSADWALKMQSDSDEPDADLGINHDCMESNQSCLCLPHTSVNQDVASTRPDPSAERCENHTRLLDEHAAVYENESPPILPPILCPDKMDAIAEPEQGDQGRDVAEEVRA